MQGRHTEFFGPDFARGPFASSNLETSALQIATAIAQLRTPLERSDEAITAHAEYIRTLAEALAPDAATSLKISTGDSPLGKSVTFRANYATRTLLRVWVAGYGGGGPRSPLDTIIWLSGVVIETIEEGAQYVIATDSGGTASMHISDGAAPLVYIGAARGARIFYSSAIQL